MNSQDFKVLPAGITPFPSADSVFVEDHRCLSNHLIPLLTIDLSTIRPEDPLWTGLIHVLEPMEHVEGIVGDETPHTHGPLLRPNWIGFYLEENRYRLAGDPSYFFMHPDNSSLEEPSDGIRVQMGERKREVLTAMEAAKRGYSATGKLLNTPYDDANHQNSQEWFEQLGGNVSSYGNWVEMVDFPMEYEPAIGDEYDADDEFAFPLSPAGNRFYHVATVPGYSYVPDATCILLFFEPIERIALLTYDWS